jgi:hypothetical protein
LSWLVLFFVPKKGGKMLVDHYHARQENSLEQMSSTIKTLQDPLYATLAAEYQRDRQDFVCGPASIVLSRMLEVETGVPISRNQADAERLELVLGFYDPGEGALEPASDHTHLRYYNGHGAVLFIDPVYPRLWGTEPRTHAPIAIRAFAVSEIDEALQAEYLLHPWQHYSKVSPRLTPFDLWGLGFVDYPTHFEEFEDIVNSPEATKDIATAPSTGQQYDLSAFFGPRIRRVGESILSSLETYQIGA